MRKYIIYKITNLINGKIYIGRTSVGIKSRWRGHIRRFKDGLYSHLRLYRAFAKYGIENFKIEEIDSCESFEEMKKLEGKYITDLDSFNKNIGYNMCIDTSKGLEFFDEETLFERGKSIHITHSNKKKSKTGFIGVSVPYEKSKLFRAAFSFKNKRYVFNFDTIEKAAECHDKIAVLFYGKDAVLNFPEKIDLYLNEDLDRYLVEQIESVGSKCLPKYLGVLYNKGADRWVFKVWHKDTRARVEISTFDSEEDAYLAQLEFIQNNPDYIISRAKPNELMYYI